MLPVASFRKRKTDRDVASVEGSVVPACREGKLGGLCVW